MCVPTSKQDRVLKDPAGTDPPFTFLVTGEESFITSKVTKEVVEYKILVEFTSAALTQVLTDLNRRFSNFENLPFFSDTELKSEFISYTSPGFYGLAKAEELGSHILKYKNEKQVPPTATCSKTLLEFKLGELERLRVNLDYRFSYISADWTAEHIKTSSEAQEVLLSWISVFNDGVGDLSELIQDIAVALEALTDHVFPNQFLGEIKSCHESKSSTEGEEFEVLACMGHTKGFSCNVTITQPTEFMSVWPLYPVVYDNIRIQGHTHTQLFFKSTESHTIMLADCAQNGLAHPFCQISSLPATCKHNLEEAKVMEIIDSCNFTITEMYPPYYMLNRGGILIQQGADSVKLGGQVVTDPLPIIGYCTGVLTLTLNRQELNIYPAVTSRTNIVVNSALSPSQLQALKDKLYWQDLADEMDTGAYIDLAFAIFELITLPCLLFSFIKVCRGKLGNNKGSNKGERRRIYKENVALLRQR
jgi:hypothetical protein